MKNKKLLRFGFAVAAVVFIVGSSLSVFAAELPEKLVPVGRTAGIKLFADGVLVVETSEVETATGRATPAKDCGLASGDIILRVGKNSVSEIEMLGNALNGRAGLPTELLVRRGEKELSLWVTPVENKNGESCIGAAVRDSIAGIGTITYYDPESETFGALGHGICQSENGELFPCGSGCLVPSSVVGVNVGKEGEPGELLGVFDSNGDCGSISSNTICGIFGSLAEDELYGENLSAEALPVADGVKKGSALIMSNVSGTDVGIYGIEIVKILGSDRQTKNFLFKVTDETLLNTTGGIVQGMSGSPIIQDGKIVGAVTHVLVNDPTMGYGILIENMLDAAA